MAAAKVIMEMDAVVFVFNSRPRPGLVTTRRLLLAPDRRRWDGPPDAD